MHRRNIAASGEGPEFFAEYKVRDLYDLVSARSSICPPARILDFGAGVGNSSDYFCRYFPEARTTCVDVSLRSLTLGASRHASQCDFVAFDGLTLPFQNGVFDAVFAACVFHHIPAEQHVSLFREMHRVLRPGGVLMVFEHNPFNPLTVRAVNTCPFDENAVLISARCLRERLIRGGFVHAKARFRVFFPRALRWLRPLESLLGRLPLGAQYYIWAER